MDESVLSELRTHYDLDDLAALGSELPFSLDQMALPHHVPRSLPSTTAAGTLSASQFSPAVLGDSSAYTMPAVSEQGEAVLDTLRTLSFDYLISVCDSSTGEEDSQSLAWPACLSAAMLDMSFPLHVHMVFLKQSSSSWWVISFLVGSLLRCITLPLCVHVLCRGGKVLPLYGRGAFVL